jgi:hypothetical protein
MFCQVCVALLAVAIGWLVSVAFEMNAFKTASSYNDGRCRLVHADGAVGLEDGDESNGLIVFGADNRRQWLQLGGGSRADALRAAPSGHLFRFTDDQRLVKLTLRGLAERGVREFHPHGVSLRGTVLFVINHASDGDSVLRFEIDAAAGTATLLDVVVDHELLEHLNDVVQVSPTDFLATRWENVPSTTPRGLLETLLKLPLMYVVRCRRAAGAAWTCAKVIENVAMPNGINLVGTKLLVAHPTLRKVAVYDFDATSGAVVHAADIPIESAGDNVHVTSRGRILLTSHFQSLKFLAHTKDAATASPTVVSELSLAGGGGRETLLLQTTKLNAGAVTVEANNGDLLVGGVFDAGVLVCQK